MLQCPVCHLNNFQRLNLHLKRIHGLTRDKALELWPGLQLEVPPTPIEVPCSECGKLVPGNTRTAYIKCADCRIVDHRPKIKCQVCGKEKRRLHIHLRAAHGISIEEYQDRFPESALAVPESFKRSDECREKQSRSASVRWSDPEKRKAHSELLQGRGPWSGQNLSEDHRRAISEGGRGVVHNLSEENRKRVGDRGRRVLLEVIRRPEVRKKISCATKLRSSLNPSHGFKNDLTRAKSYETRKRNGTLISPNAGRGICGFRKGLSHYTRSTMEANFARVLVASGVRYEYEPRCFNFGEHGNYTPDFFLHNPLKLGEETLVESGWVEIKGWRYKDGSLPGPADKKIYLLRRAVSQPVTVLAGEDDAWLKIQENWKDKISWETSRFNLRSHPAVFEHELKVDSDFSLEP